MWTRRDLVLCATAVVTTFGITVAAFWSRTAVAVDNFAGVTAKVEVPTLELGAVHVSAVIDHAKARTVNLILKNNSTQKATAHFNAKAAMVDPTSLISRGEPMARTVWSEAYSVDLMPGQTKIVPVLLPEAAFNFPPAKSNVPTQGGRSFLSLSTTDAKEPVSIQAVTLKS